MTPDQHYQLVLSSVQSRGAAEDWFRLGVILEDQGCWAAAASAFARAANLRPEDHRAWCAAGWLMHRSGRHREGADCLALACHLRPDDGLPYALLAQVLVTLNREDEAVELGRRGVELAPGVDKVHLGYSFALSAAGRWADGWAEYEWRFQREIPEFLTRPYPLWRGETVERLFIEAEQGLGDTIFALRWVHETARRVPSVVLYVQQAVWALVRSVVGLLENVAVYPMPRALPAADAWCPMLSLPVALDCGEPDGGEAYLNPGIGIWPPVRPPMKVGLCWAGNPTHGLAHWRDVALPYLLPLTEIPGTEWHGLQIGSGASQIGELGAYGLIVDRAPEITNFLDTAQIVAGLDLVVTVDTAVAHLAGAMGVPCWVLLTDRATDFRWGRRSSETGWYRSWRIFRRGPDEDWSALVARVGDALREKAG